MRLIKCGNTFIEDCVYVYIGLPRAPLLLQSFRTYSCPIHILLDPSPPVRLCILFAYVSFLSLYFGHINFLFSGWPSRSEHARISYPRLSTCL